MPLHPIVLMACCSKRMSCWGLHATHVQGIAREGRGTLQLFVSEQLDWLCTDGTGSRCRYAEYSMDDVSMFCPVC